MKGQTNAWVESIISGEKLYITLTTNQSDHSDLLGAVITIAFDDTIIEYIWDGNIIEYIIPTSKYYKVSFSTVEGYTTPEFFGGKAVNGNVHEVLGVYNTEMLTVNVNDVSGYEITTSKKVKVGSTIPERYTQLEYIESTGSQYINTGFYPNHNTRIDIDFEAISTNNAGAENGLVLYGSGYSAENSAYECYAWNQQLEINYGNSNINFITTLTPGVKLRLSQNKSAISIYNFSSASTTTYSLPEQTFKTPYPMALFGAKRNNNILGYQKVFGCQIYDDGVLIRDYVPAKDENNIAGLYDRVYNKFYPSASSTAFVAGPVVVYTQVEYIESTGTQYIDTGFKPNQDTKVVVDVVFPTKPTNHAALFGSRETNTKQFWTYYRYSDNAYSMRYNNISTNKTLSYDATQRALVTMDKNVLYVNDTSVSATAGTFSTDYPLTIFAANNAGTMQYYSSCKLYSCQIYDNGTLIRDYVPVKNLEGIAGFYDKVNGVFYPSASSTAFSAGEEVYETIAVQTTSTMSYKISFGTEYIISASNITGYTSPSSKSFVASQVDREVVMEYAKVQYGVYAEGLSGMLYNLENFNDQEPLNSLVVVNENCSLRIATPVRNDYKAMGIAEDTFKGRLNFVGNLNSAKTLFNGHEQTQEILNIVGLSSDTASVYATNYIFPDGKTTGYIPSVGELNAIALQFHNNSLFKDMAKEIGIIEHVDYYYWTSTYGNPYNYTDNGDTFFKYSFYSINGWSYDDATNKNTIESCILVVGKY